MRTIDEPAGAVSHDLVPAHRPSEVPVALYRATAHGRFMDVNQAMVDLTGYPDKDALLAAGLSELHCDASQSQRHTKSLESDGVLIGFDFEARHYSGRRFWVQDNARLELDEDGNIACISGALVDVTARRRAVEALEESEKRFRALFSSSPVAMWEEDFSALAAWLERLRSAGVADLRSYLLSRPWEVRRGIRLVRVVDVNTAGLALIGTDAEDRVVGPISDAAVAPESEAAFVETMMAVWEGRTRFDIDIVCRTMSGERMHCMLHWASAPNGDGSDLSRVVVSLVDVSALRDSENRLRNQVRSKDQLVAAVSHQLRTPLTSVVGFAAELLDRWETLEPGEGRAFAGVIGEQGAELARIVDDLMVAASGDVGLVPIDNQLLDLRQQVVEVVNGVPARAAAAITVDGGEARAVGDPARVRQILRNMLDNADRHGGRRIEVCVEQRRHSAKVAVLDNGPGIPSEHIDRAFERYQRVGTQTDGGTIGLGLAISRDLARRMGGDLTYHRVQGVTTFELYLPVPHTGAEHT